MTLRIFKLICLVTLGACLCCIPACGCTDSTQQDQAASTDNASNTSDEQLSTDETDQSANSDSSSSAQDKSSPSNPSSNNQSSTNKQPKTVNATIGGSTFTLDLADNETAQAFVKLLPLQIEMSELNGNEKYSYLSTTLPSNPTNPGTIEVGDVMLYQSNCLVMFYKSHPTSYSYTRIGKITNSTGLAEACGAGATSAQFSLQ